MSEPKSAFKENAVLIVGLVVPFLMIVAFMVHSVVKAKVEPGKYDFIFAIPQSNYYQGSSRMEAKLVVNSEGVLMAQYLKPEKKNANYNYYRWYKIYRYEVETQSVRELPFGYPPDVDSLDSMREEPVKATEGLRLDSSSRSPDGWELDYDRYRSSGLIEEIFGGRSSSGQMRLKKEDKSILLSQASPKINFYHGNFEFLGWVIQEN